MGIENHGGEEESWRGVVSWKRIGLVPEEWEVRSYVQEKMKM